VVLESQPVDAEHRPLESITRPQHASYAGDMMRNTERKRDDRRSSKGSKARIRREEGVRMSDREGSGRRWSRVSLILIGILLGSLFVRPAVAHIGTWAHNWTVHIRPRVQAYGDSRWVRKAAVQTGYFSCAGTAWESALGATVYDTNNSLKYRISGDTGRFRCSVELPHGATVKAVRFSVVDSDAANVTCRLDRTNMALSIGTELNMANVATTGTPGAVRIEDTSINSGVVDNAAYSYFVQCDVPGTTIDTGVYGANIEYTVSGLNGAAS
jgi:hypothetical protein